MAFESLTELINMGGHGAYVWSAYLISIFLLTLLLWKPLSEQKKILKEINQQMVREKNRPLSEKS